MSRGSQREPYHRRQRPALFAGRRPTEYNPAELAELAKEHIVGEQEDMGLLIAYLQEMLERHAHYLEHRAARGTRTNTDDAMWKDMQAVGLVICYLREKRI